MQSSAAEFMKAHPNSDSLTPLATNIRQGLIAVTVLAWLSFFSSSVLLFYLCYKLISWNLRKRSLADVIQRNLPDPQPVTDFTFEDGAYGPQGQSTHVAHDQNLRRLKEAKKSPPNQFLLLLFNLIIADLHQSTSYALSASWLVRDSIMIYAPACFVQGFLDGNRDLASSLFITTIAIHTYLSVVKKYRPPQNVVYVCIVGIWIFTYCMTIIPLLVTHNGRDVGGYFVRAGAWCWISEAYESLRLLTHYMFIFLSLLTTSGLYIAIFFSLHRQAREQAYRVNPDGPRVGLSHNPVFLMYPFIYVTCTLPLAAGRLATMAGSNVPIGYYLFAGALIASNGFFDTLLFSTTRYAIVFGSFENVNAEETGVETFAFMRTPAAKYGNTVWIQGPRPGDSSRGEGLWKGLRGRWWPRVGTQGRRSLKTRSISQESLRGAAANDMEIQMDVVTSVGVEIDMDKEMDPRYSNAKSTGSPSLSDSDFKPT